MIEAETEEVETGVRKTVRMNDPKEPSEEERKEHEEHTARLERTLGRVVVEKEFLVKKCRELGIEP